MADEKTRFEAGVQQEEVVSSPAAKVFPSTIFDEGDIEDLPVAQPVETPVQLEEDVPYTTTNLVPDVNPFTVPNEKISNALQGHVSFVQESFEVGNNQIKSASLARQVMSGEKTWEEVEPEIIRLGGSAKQVEFKSFSPQDLMPFIVGSTIEQLPILGEIGKGIVGGAAIGGAGGVAVGAATSGPVGAFFVGNAGIALGGTTGLVATSYELNSAEGYIDYRRMGFTHKDSLVMARIYGGVASILDVVTLKIGAGVTKKVLREFVFSDAVKKALAIPILNSLRAVSVGAIKEGLTEAAQELTENILAHAYSLAVDYNVKKLPKPLEMVAGAFQSFAKGAAATVGLGGAGITLSASIQKSIQSFESKPVDKMTGPMIAREVNKLEKSTRGKAVLEVKATIARALSHPAVVQKMAEAEVSRKMLNGYIRKFILSEEGTGRPLTEEEVEVGKAAFKAVKDFKATVDKYYDQNISEKFSLKAEDKQSLSKRRKEVIQEEEYEDLDDRRKDQKSAEADFVDNQADFYSGALAKVDPRKQPGEKPVLSDEELAKILPKKLVNLTNASPALKESLTFLVRRHRDINLRKEIDNSDFVGKLFLYLTSPDVGGLDAQVELSTIERFFPLGESEVNFYGDLILGVKEFFDIMTKEMGMTLPEFLKYAKSIEKVETFDALVFKNPEFKIINTLGDTNLVDEEGLALASKAQVVPQHMSRARALDYYGKSQNSVTLHSAVESNGIVSPALKKQLGRTENTLYESIEERLTDNDRKFIAGIQKAFKAAFPQFQEDAYVYDDIKIAPESNYFGPLHRMGHADSIDRNTGSMVLNDTFNTLGLETPEVDEDSNVAVPGQHISRVRSTAKIDWRSPVTEVITYLDAITRYRHYRTVSRSYMKALNNKTVQTLLGNTPEGKKFREAVTDHISHVTLSPKVLKQIHGMDIFSEGLGSYLPSYMFGGNPLAIAKQATGMASLLQILTPGQINRVSKVLEKVDGGKLQEIKDQLETGEITREQFANRLDDLIEDATKDLDLNKILDEEHSNFGTALVQMVKSLSRPFKKDGSDKIGDAIITSLGHPGFKLRFDDPRSTVTGSGRGTSNIAASAEETVDKIRNSPMQDLNFSFVLAGDKYASSVISTFVYVHNKLEGKTSKEAANEAFKAVDRTQSSGLLSSRQLTTLSDKQRFITFAFQAQLAQRQLYMMAQREEQIARHELEMVETPPGSGNYELAKNKLDEATRKKVNSYAAMVVANSAFGLTALVYTGATQGFTSDEFKTAFVIWLVSSFFPARSPMTNLAVIAFGPKVVAGIVKATTGVNVKTYDHGIQSPGQSSVARFANSLDPIIALMTGSGNWDKASEGWLGAIASGWLMIPFAANIIGKNIEPFNFAPFIRLLGAIQKGGKRAAKVTSKQNEKNWKDFENYLEKSNDEWGNLMDELKGEEEGKE